ncbi:MAG: metalloregulator ArsR/SmtB family transcription factor [Thermoanaerobaculales bacterium]|jgi:arsenate reductase/ArsR family transcriptional regulator|nr:metalloregulator ArsR/SmtB family transcription factor [Thermoanaerobaculales bacterium]
MNTPGLDAAITAARALGHPARLRTAAMLRTGELCLCQITEVLGLAPSTVSLHLKELRRAGLVSERKDGRWVHFSLADDPEARRWLDTALGAVAGDPQLVRDGELVRELRDLPLADLCGLGYEAALAKRDRGLPDPD